MASRVSPVGAYLGIDVGTSVAKVALFSRDGDLVTSANRPLNLQHPGPGEVEQNPEEIITALRDTITDISAHPTTDLDLVGLTAQGDGLWLLDETAHPVRPAVSWMDARGTELVRGWEETGVTAAIYRINGTSVFSGATAPILRWLDLHEPGRLDAATTVGHCKDLIFQRLTGVRATDASNLMSFSDGTGGYSSEALALLGLSHRLGLLAPVVPTRPLARVTPAGASELGLPPGVEVCNGPMDLAACAAGAGVREVGDGLLIIGTTLACLTVTDHVDTTGEPAGINVATGTPGRSLRAMAAMAGTASMDWLLTTLGMTHADLEDALDRSPVGANGVTVLPYLAPSGERAPFVDPAACGQFHGVRMMTTRADLVRGLCEGLAYAARQCLEAAGPAGRLVVCGGGTRSPAWLRVFASVLDRPLELARAPEVGARGAVVSALRATDRNADIARWTRTKGLVYPDQDAAALYHAGYARYLDEQAHARQRWHI